MVFDARNNDEFDKVGLLKGNTNTVLYLQFDRTGEYAMTNAIDGAVLCWHMVLGAFNKVDIGSVRDLDWERKTCVFSWDTLGIWSKS